MRKPTHALLCLLTATALATPMKVTDAQKVGNLRLGLESSQLAPLLGKPSKEGKPVEEGATGLTVKDQTFKKQGVVVTLSREKKARVWRVERFVVTAPCAWKTPQGIGVGSTDQEVRKVYGQLLDAESQAAGQLVVGTIYDGVIFHIKKGKVESIFVGAAAE
ncbi:MAG: hypothetical protein KF760_05820 [Candidatus Eremiobacteraeota bacterium]|nr:hypothetical protein [Candidatus Eremiobacteraeota bacterium]MCW5867088.1 hypothetical protein [Candidatus Eremiobacteraeota bacterium]